MAGKNATLVGRVKQATDWVFQRWTTLVERVKQLLGWGRVDSAFRKWTTAIAEERVLGEEAADLGDALFQRVWVGLVIGFVPILLLWWQNWLISEQSRSFREDSAIARRQHLIATLYETDCSRRKRGERCPPRADARSRAEAAKALVALRPKRALWEKALGRDPRIVDLTRAELVKVDLSESDLQSVNFQSAMLRGAKFREATLHGAKFHGARLDRAKFQKALLRGVDFRAADLREALFNGADLRGANLKCADLRSAHLDGARLQGAKLQGANLRGAKLKGAKLKGAKLDAADLHGADFEDAKHLDQTQINLAYGNAKVTLPRGAELELPQHWKFHDLKPNNVRTLEDICDSRVPRERDKNREEPIVASDSPPPRNVDQRRHLNGNLQL